MCRSEATLRAYTIMPDSRPQAIVQRPQIIYYLEASFGDDYYTIQAQGDAVCNPDNGLLKPLSAELAERAGLRFLQVRNERWLTGE
jgi:hypothetical protein